MLPHVLLCYTMLTLLCTSWRAFFLYPSMSVLFLPSGGLQDEVFPVLPSGWCWGQQTTLCSVWSGKNNIAEPFGLVNIPVPLHAMQQVCLYCGLSSPIWIVGNLSPLLLSPSTLSISISLPPFTLSPLFLPFSISLQYLCFPLLVSSVEVVCGKRLQCHQQRLPAQTHP